jgi:hypothetical protein
MVGRWAHQGVLQAILYKGTGILTDPLLYKGTGILMALKNGADCGLNMELMQMRVIISVRYLKKRAINSWLNGSFWKSG